MARPAIDLEPHKARILELYATCTWHDILRIIEDESGVSISRSTLEKRLQVWRQQEDRKRKRTDNNEELRKRISHLFFQERLKDTEILKVLRDEGRKVEIRALQRIRKGLGMMRRIPDNKRPEADDELLEIVAREMRSDENVAKLGRVPFYNYMRSKKYAVSRDRLSRASRAVDPEGFQRRLRGSQFKRKEQPPPEEQGQQLQMEDDSGPVEYTYPEPNPPRYLPQTYQGQAQQAHNLPPDTCMLQHQHQHLPPVQYLPPGYIYHQGKIFRECTQEEFANIGFQSRPPAIHSAPLMQ